jgi:S1-C subfamily serine protease
MKAYIVALAIAAAVIIAIPPALPKTNTTTDAVVFVDQEQGHGSGTHLGNGVILTAAHVVDGVDDFIIKDDKGNTSPGKVLWASKDYDVALIQTQYAGPSRSISCSPLRNGQPVHAVGNPGSLEFISTYGHVANPTPIKIDDTNELVTLDLNAGRGMSGGPLLDAQGRVVGVVVAITNPARLVGSFTFAVPSSTLCRLLARA